MSKLRENIDRILGNSIRCLLPSYWWKRLFGMVVDEVEKVKNSIGTLEDGYKALEESKADADTFIMLKTTELDRMEYGAVYLVRGQRDSLKVNFWEYKSPRPDVLNWTIWFSNKTSLEVTSNGVAFQWEGGTPTIDLSNLNPNSLYRLDCTLVTVGASGTTVKYVKRVARIVEYGDSAKYDTFVSETSTNAVQNKVIKAYVDSKQAVVYFPEKEEDTLPQEMIASNATAFNLIKNRTSEQPINITVYGYSVNQYSPVGYYLSRYQSIQLMTFGLDTHVISVIPEHTDNLRKHVNTLLIYLHQGGSITLEKYDNYDAELSDTSINAVQNKVVTAELAKKQDNLVSGTSIKTINGTTLLGSGDIKVAADVTVDSSLSSTSTNPVQNKVVYNALQGKASTSSVTSLDNSKADKTDIKTLNGVSLLGGGNLQLGDGQTIVYDDSDVQSKLVQLEGGFDDVYDKMDAIWEEVDGVIDDISYVIDYCDEKTYDAESIAGNVAYELRVTEGHSLRGSTEFEDFLDQTFRDWYSYYVITDVESGDGTDDWEIILRADSMDFTEYSIKKTDLPYSLPSSSVEVIGSYCTTNVKNFKVYHPLIYENKKLKELTASLESRIAALEGNQIA